MDWLIYWLQPVVQFSTLLNYFVTAAEERRSILMAFSLLAPCFIISFITLLYLSCIKLEVLYIDYFNVRQK